MCFSLLFHLWLMIISDEMAVYPGMSLAGVGNIAPENDAIRIRRMMIGCMRGSFGNGSTSQLRSILSLNDRMGYDSGCIFSILSILCWYTKLDQWIPSIYGPLTRRRPVPSSMADSHLPRTLLGPAKIHWAINSLALWSFLACIHLCLVLSGPVWT